jgi:DHA2 family multidrug resistance protein
MDAKSVMALFGIVLAALTAEFNDGVTSAALEDVLGGLGVSHDPGTWLESLYASGQVIGMSLATFWAVTISVRRFAIFAIALCGITTVCIPLCANLTLLFMLRFFEGMSAGFIIPLLLAIALRVLPPAIRLYGLAGYALTATFGPNIATALAGLWTEFVDWRFIFWEPVPLCLLSGTMIWYAVPQDPTRYERIALFDWRGALLIAIGAGSLTTLLEQGDRYDWFNSPVICVLALASVVGLGLLIPNELKQELPLYKFELLRRRNLAYALIALFTFLLLNLAASTIPAIYLHEVVGFRPVQVQLITLPIALAQLIMLPAIAVLLNFEPVDARIVSFIGIALVIAACVGDSFLTSEWRLGEFYLWQGCAAVGEPMIILPLLMMATNTIHNPADGPYASTLVNSTRAFAEPVGVWMVQLILRWRGGLHYNRLVDQVGQDRYGLFQGQGLVPGNRPPLSPTGVESAPGAVDAFMSSIRGQAIVLTLSDCFVIIAGLAVALIAVLFILPQRTYPPRLEFAKK